MDMFATRRQNPTSKPVVLAKTFAFCKVARLPRSGTRLYWLHAFFENHLKLLRSHQSLPAGIAEWPCMQHDGHHHGPETAPAP